MKKLLWCAALAACGGSDAPPPAAGPIVDSMMPATGNWGTQVTIDGANFGAILATGDSVTFSDMTGANGFVLDSWTETEIVGRVAFPATGALAVQTAAGHAMAGTFATTTPWMPSESIDVALLADQIVLSSGYVAGLYRQHELTNVATLAVFGGPAAGSYPLTDVAEPSDSQMPLGARVVEADDGTPLVIASKDDGSVVAYTLAGGVATEAATQLSGTVIAAARDATGAYAWIETADGLVRARPGASWTTDRGPYTTPFTPLDGAIAADGTLFITVAEPGTGNASYVSIQSLAPTDSALGGVERADPSSHSDPIALSKLTLAADGVHALVSASTEAGGTMTALTPRVRTAAATWSDAPAMTGLVQYEFVGTTLGAVVNNTTSKTTSLVPDATQPATATVIPVWPALAESAVVDANGQVYPIVTSGEVRYALTPPAQH